MFVLTGLLFTGMQEAGGVLQPSPRDGPDDSAVAVWQNAQSVQSVGIFPPTTLYHSHTRAHAIQWALLVA